MKWNVKSQMMSLCTSWKMSECLSRILHHNQLLLIILEVERSIPLCMGVHTTWARCTSSNLDKPTPEGSEIEDSTQWVDCLVPTLHQASKPPLGWISGKLCALPWTSAGTSIQDQGWKVVVKEFIVSRWWQRNWYQPIDTCHWQQTWESWPIHHLIRVSSATGEHEMGAHASVLTTKMPRLSQLLTQFNS